MSKKFDFPNFEISREVFEIWMDIYNDDPGYNLINKKNFLVFSKTEKSKKYLFFSEYGEDTIEATNKIFQLTGWNELFISSSASLFLYLENEEVTNLPILVLYFDEDNQNDRISYDDIQLFEYIEEGMNDVVKDFDKCLIRIKIGLNHLKKNDLIHVKK